MSSSAARVEPIGVHLTIDDNFLHLRLADGRELSVPLAWYPKLIGASSEQRANWRWIGGGVGVHWPDIDEDLSVLGMLLGPVGRLEKG